MIGGVGPPGLVGRPEVEIEGGPLLLSDINHGQMGESEADVVGIQEVRRHGVNFWEFGRGILLFHLRIIAPLVYSSSSSFSVVVFTLTLLRTPTATGGRLIR